ncbi:MAG: hypothetical protein P1P59_11495 [Treponemataceae bacterium]
MKKFRRVAFALVALALVGGLVSCKFKPNAHDLELYNEFINETAMVAQEGEIPVSMIVEMLPIVNSELTSAKIVDKQAGQPVKKGTTKAELEKRFVLEKK